MTRTQSERPVRAMVHSPRPKLLVARGGARPFAVVTPAQIVAALRSIYQEFGMPTPRLGVISPVLAGSLWPNDNRS